jgi:hypothetical protein
MATNAEGRLVTHSRGNARADGSLAGLDAARPRSCSPLESVVRTVAAVETSPGRSLLAGVFQD